GLRARQAVAPQVADALRPGVVPACRIALPVRYPARQKVLRVVKLQADPPRLMADVERAVMYPAAHRGCRVLRETEVTALIGAIPPRLRLELGHPPLVGEHLRLGVGEVSALPHMGVGVRVQPLLLSPSQRT